MPPKRPSSSKASCSAPKRKMLTIADKVELLDMLKEGRSFAAVGRHYGINESTVRYIKKEEANIRRTASFTFNKTAKRVVTPRNKTIVQMESALAPWIADCWKKNISLNTSIIQTKAKMLYETFAANEHDDDSGNGEEEVKEEMEDPQPGASSDSPPRKPSFVASNGWFAKFQKRFGLKSISVHGDAASADTAAAEYYLNNEFKKNIKEGRYAPEQVFNMDETGLFWKRMPSRTFLFKEEAKAPGFKAHKDRVTLVMCGNAAGFMLKPGLVYKSKNPRALKNKNKNLLPVYWMHNPKAEITKILISDWFHQCFIPQVRVYLAEKGLEFKVLLLMDNAGGHATDLHYDGVQVEFLPPYTSSLIQPMDQGVIRAFKALYTRNALTNLVGSMDADEGFTLTACWRNYTIATCLLNIQNALNEMKSATINASWKKLWPEVVHEYEGFAPDEVYNSEVEKAVKLAALLGGEGFKDMTHEDVNKLIDCHSQPLSDEDLEELIKSASEEEEQQRQVHDEVEEPGLTLERLATMCNMARELQRLSQQWDDDMVRSVHFCNVIDDAMTPYKTILAQKRKQRQQLPITMFFSCKKQPVRPLTLTLSEEAAEEGSQEMAPLSDEP